MLLLSHILSILLLVASAGNNPQTDRAVPEKPRPVIEFGHEGGNLRPYTIAIYEDGRIDVTEGKPALKVTSIPPKKLGELVEKAADRSFWKRGRIQQRPALPDFGFVFVRVRTATGRIVYHHGARSGPLGEYYDLLSDLILEQQ